ncbi:DUF4065 domain-containing protein [Trueperella pecoris]|uniref:DUF4065 domain-containing protein n=1 Tax=Trueperella pecoris TaxID=2733571 RepID=A0A7M1QZV7_9ACTO|nr:DUF4065 domain-containing protein [Trueperella pecoris]
MIFSDSISPPTSVGRADFYACAGPVAPDSFRYHRGQYFVASEAIPSSGEVPNARELSVIDEVCEALGKLSGKELSDRTHVEDPWLHARRDLSPTDRGSQIITKSAIMNYYRNHPVIAP